MIRLLLILVAALASFPVQAQRVNLAKFQATASDSNGDSTSANEAVDGIVSNESRWYSNTDGTLDHWLEVRLTAPYQVGSAHLFLGLDDWKEPRHIEIQFHNGAGWQTIPSTVRTNNGATDLVLEFGSPVTATRFRAFTTDEILRIKEFALYPWNNGCGRLLAIVGGSGYRDGPWQWGRSPGW